jgi:isochorismate hydrolase
MTTTRNERRASIRIARLHVAVDAVMRLDDVAPDTRALINDMFVDAVNAAADAEALVVEWTPAP